MYTVYKTTNQINNNYYIGVHKTSNPQDSYLGSGLLLKSAIKKYGRKNFKKEILFIFDNSEDAYKKERELVNENFVSLSESYNVALGGVPSVTGYKRIPQSHHTNKGCVWITNGIENRLCEKSKTLPEGFRYGRTIKKPTISKEKDLLRRERISNSNKGRTSPMKGKTLTAEDKKKKSISAYNRKPYQCPKCMVCGDPGNMKRWHKCI